MTAINAVGHATGAYLMTDAASYHADSGIVTGFSCKARTYPHLNMATAVTGTGINENEIATRMRRFASFDEAVAGAAAMLREAWDDGALDVGDDELSHVRLMLAGWSAEKRRGEVYTISTKAEDDSFVLHNRSVQMSPAVDLDGLRKIGVLSGNATSLTFDDPADFLDRLIDLQRAIPHPVPGRPDNVKHTVGGAAVLTVINAAGIYQRVVKRWPDRIGETIDPTALAEPVTSAPAVPAGLSRLQRERMEKKARKAASR